MEDLKRKKILLGTYEAFILGYKVSEDGKSLVTSFADHAHSGSVRAIAAADKFMITSGEDENVKIFNLRRRSEHGNLTHADSTINSIKFFEKKFLFTGSESGKISILKSGNWRVEKTFNKHQGGVVDISIHPSGKLALSIAKDKKLITWNLVKGRSAYVTNIKEIATVVEWSPSGEHYLVGYFRRVEVYSLATAKIVFTIELKGRCNGVLFLDDMTLAVAGEMPHIEIYSLVSSKKIFSFDAHETRVRNMQLVDRTSESPDRLIVTSSTDGLIKVWSLGTQADGQFCSNMLTQVDTKCRITCMIVHEVPVLPEQTSLIEVKKVKEPKPSVEKKKLKRPGFVVSTLPDTETQPKKIKRNKSKETSDRKSPTSGKATMKLQKPDKDPVSTPVALKKANKTKLQKPKSVQIKV